MAKNKVKPAQKSNKKAPAKAAKPAKTAEKKKVSAAPKTKPVDKKAKLKTQSVAAPKKPAKAHEPKKEAKKGKAPKKEAKSKQEELDLFDDGEVSESEELLEYQEELDVADDEETEEVEAEDEPSDAPDADEATEAPAVAAPVDEEDIVLTDAEGNRYCRAKDCDQIEAVEGYCRYHYLLFWRKIQIRKEILQDGKLEKYVDDLTSRYPDKFVEILRKDLRTTKDFLAAIAELEIDESAGENEFEEDAQTFIDEVRGLSDTGTTIEDDEAF